MEIIKIIPWSKYRYFPASEHAEDLRNYIEKHFNYYGENDLAVKKGKFQQIFPLKSVFQPNLYTF